MDKGQSLYKKAKQLIPGGTMLLSKRPDMFLPEGVGQINLEDPFSGQNIIVSPNKIRKFYHIIEIFLIYSIKRLL